MKTAHQQAKKNISTTRQWSWFYYLFPPFLLAIAAFICYFPSRNFAFQFDDLANILKNYNIRLNTFGKLFYTNTRWFIFWLNALYYRMGKFDPYYYRMGNICAHIILGIIVFFFFFLALSHLKKRSFFSENAFFLAFLSAGMFLLHPVQTQTVSYVIQGQLEGIASLFIMSMTLCFWLSQWVQQQFIRSLLYLFLFALAFIAPGTKEIAIVAPLLIVLVDWFLIAQGSSKEFKQRWWIHGLVALLVWGGYLFLLKPTFFVELFGFSMKARNNLGNIITSSPVDMITPWAYLISEFKVILHYLWIFLWPFNISVEYDWVLSRSFFAFDCFIPFVALATIIGLLLFQLRRDRTNLIVFGLFWFFIYIAPRSTIIPSAELIVDYKTYGASIGFLFVVAIALLAGWYFLSNYFKKFSSVGFSLPVRLTLVVGVCMLCAWGARQRNMVWSSGIEFWGSMIKTAPGKARIYNNYGVELSQNHKKYVEAIPYFQKAIALDRNYPDPHTNLAVSYAFTGKVDEAIAELQESLRINPYNPEAYNNIAAFFTQKKEYDKAEKALRSALALRPTYGKALLNLACVYKSLGKNNEALALMRQATTKADLDNDFGFDLYARVAMEMQAYDDAIFALNKYLELKPESGEHLFYLGNAFFFKGDLDQAMKAYENARLFLKDDPRIIFNLAECYIRRKDIQTALHHLEAIRKFTPQMPPIAFKIADCYVRLGNRKAAEAELNNVLACKIPDQFKNQAVAMLDQIKRGQPVTVPV